MTLSLEEATQRHSVAKRHSVLGRWNQAEPATDEHLWPVYRVVCGASKCPASLGMLHASSLDDVFEMRTGLVDSAREMVNAIEEILATKAGEQRTPLLRLVALTRSHVETCAEAAELARK